MNRSGRSIEACADFYGLEPEQILVIHDDIDLPVGKIKVVKAGRSGGHRGVSSIIEHLGSDAFPRLKIGIGRPRYGETIEAYVLSPFYEDEKEIVKKLIQLAVQACEWFVSEGVESAMNHINCRTISGKEVRS
jgi:PTH1 family peptidyl-tRNA hydrolase